MNIEDEIFKKKRLNKDKLISYGFNRDNKFYKYSKEFMNGSFRADVYIDDNSNVMGKVYDLNTGDEYVNFRIDGINGEYVSTVREEYRNILRDIADNCFDKCYFVSKQANRIADKICKKYNVNLEFLWDKFPNYGVFRNSRSGKWFAAIMDVLKNKIVSSSDSVKVEVIDLKLGDVIDNYLDKDGVFPAYHFSKKSWVTIILDDTLSDEEIMNMIDISYNLSDRVNYWIFPANPKYYDIVGAFNDNDTITWRQLNNVLVGDIVYLYITKPYACIMFKCEVIEVNIPYDYKDKKFSMNYIMRIKLLKKYDNDEFTFDKLKEYGVTSVRSPRKAPSRLCQELDKT